MQAQPKQHLSSKTHYYEITLFPKTQASASSHPTRNRHRKNEISSFSNSPQKDENNNYAYLLIEVWDQCTDTKQTNQRGREREHREGSCAIRLPWPVLEELTNCQAPKHVMDGILGSCGQHLGSTSKSIKIQEIQINSSNKTTPLLWFLYPLSSTSIHPPSQIEVLCSNPNNTPQLKINSCYIFRNFDDYRHCFVAPQSYQQNLAHKYKEQCNLGLLGLYYGSEDDGNGYYIVGLYLRIVDKQTGKLVDQIRLQPLHHYSEIEVQNQFQISPMAHLHQHPWQSQIDLTLLLKSTIRRLIFQQSPIPIPISTSTSTPTNQLTSLLHRTHYTLKYRLPGSEGCTFILYNNEKNMEDFIMCSATQENYECKEGYKVIKEQWERLGKLYRLRYPFKYYLELYRKCLGVLTCLSQGEDHDNWRTSIARLTNINQPQMQHYPLIKLCRYLLHQNIHPTKQSLPMYMQHSLAVPLSDLCADPVSPTLMVYWLISPPGSNKTKILEELKSLLYDYEVNILHVTQFQLFSKDVNKFIQGKGVFGRDRFCFCLIDFWYTRQRLEGVLAVLAEVVPRDIYYQLCLVTTDSKQTTYFQQNIKSLKQPCSPSHRIRTSYHFSLDYLICSLLTYSHSHPQPLKSLSQVLHYISSTYSNLDLKRLLSNIQTYGGNVKIIEYQTSNIVKIDWKVLEEEHQDQKEEIVQQLMILLQRSYKKIGDQDALLVYFLNNVEELQWGVSVMGVAGFVVQNTFSGLSYTRQENQFRNIERDQEKGVQ